MRNCLRTNNRIPKKEPTVPDVIQQLGQTAVPTPGESNVYCLTIIGQIEGHLVLPPQNKTTKYEHLIPQLVAAEQNPRIEGLLIILNTVGGDVEAGLAIAEMIASLSKPTVTVVIGGGHSIGVPIAVASDYSLIAESATMTIHPIRMTGLVIGVPQTFEYIEKCRKEWCGLSPPIRVSRSSSLRSSCSKPESLTGTSAPRWAAPMR